MKRHAYRNGEDRIFERSYVLRYIIRCIASVDCPECSLAHFAGGLHTRIFSSVGQPLNLYVNDTFIGQIRSAGVIEISATLLEEKSRGTKQKLPFFKA